jgi:hypothetical protein
MKFNAYASLFRTYALGQNDSSALTTPEITLFTNTAKDSLARDIVSESDGDADYFSITSYTDLIADQREYAFPQDILNDIKIIRAYIGGKWRRLAKFDINSYRIAGESSKPYYTKRVDDNFSGATTDEDTITEQFTDENPMFDIDGRTIVIYSETIDSVSAGIIMKSMVYPKDYSDSDWATTGDISVRASSTSTAMPRQTHDIMLRKAVIDYKESKGIPLSAFDKNYLQEKEVMMESLKEIALDDTSVAQIPRDDGFDY